jgi:competence protein ComEC
MVAFVETAILFRVPNNPLSALAASAMIVVLLWPMQVFSASFQMSYGIVAALLLLGLPLADAGVERWTPFRLLPKPTWCWHHRAIDGLYRKIIAAVAIGLASTLVSAVSGVLFFKLFTPAALLANLVLIPAASFVIVGGFASLVCGLVGATLLSALFNHATVVVLWAIDASVRGVVSMPGAWHVAQFAAPWIGPGSLVTLLAALAFGYATGWRRARGGWWPPFAIVALTLIFGVNYG